MTKTGTHIRGAMSLEKATNEDVCIMFGWRAGETLHDLGGLLGEPWLFHEGCLVDQFGRDANQI